MKGMVLRLTTSSHFLPRFAPTCSGYARIVFMIIAFYLCFRNPFAAAVCYCISQGLDAVDGQVARAFKQCSKFGAVLDMLTDRSATNHIGQYEKRRTTIQHEFANAR